MPNAFRELTRHTALFIPSQSFTSLQKRCATPTTYGFSFFLLMYMVSSLFLPVIFLSMYKPPPLFTFLYRRVYATRMGQRVSI